MCRWRIDKSHRTAAPSGRDRRLRSRVAMVSGRTSVTRKLKPGRERPNATKRPCFSPEMQLDFMRTAIVEQNERPHLRRTAQGNSIQGRKRATNQGKVKPRTEY